jgi:hypothetical protein
MIRRRRPQRQIAFSFDSFLDVVANVVGIILRLILVAWVGARSYHAVVRLPPTRKPVSVAEPSLPDPQAPPEPTDPLADELHRLQAELAGARNRLREGEKKRDETSSRASAIARELALLHARTAQLADERQAAKRAAGERLRDANARTLALKELSARSKQLLAELEKLKSAPSAKRALRYRTPVSQPVHEEVMFECRRGRVALVDLEALRAEMMRGVRSKEEAMRTSWEVTDVTPPVGAFRLRYTVARERTLLDGTAGGPQSRGGFRYGLQQATVEPVAPERGESADAALAAGSAFRKLVDALDPQQTAVTLWVYPDSFTLYRRLRDFLHDRDVDVAGRPLPAEVPISISPHGSASRGQ